MFTLFTSFFMVFLSAKLIFTISIRFDCVLLIFLKKIAMVNMGFMYKDNPNFDVFKTETDAFRNLIDDFFSILDCQKNFP